MRRYRFFFSSRRRHTRFDCDWSSDVCSSDLISPIIKTLDLHLTVGDGKLHLDKFAAIGEIDKKATSLIGQPSLDLVSVPRKLGVDGPTSANIRSEERRVGKECRAWVRTEL